MTSARQIEANRQNALKSTGPKTEEGKQQSRRNAIRHGFTAETVIEALAPALDAQALSRMNAAIEREGGPVELGELLVFSRDVGRVLPELAESATETMPILNVSAAVSVAVRRNFQRSTFKSTEVSMSSGTVIRYST